MPNGIKTESFPWETPGSFSGVVIGSSDNRGSRSTIGVETDCEAISVWLAECGKRSESTAQAYRREVERLILWSSLIKRKSLSQLYREDFLHFAEFIKNPGEEWIMKKRYRRNSPNWRPFLAPLSLGSQKHALVIIYSMMSYLVGVGWLVANPMPAPKFSVRSTFNPKVRSLPNEFVDCIYESLDQRVANTPKEKTEKARDKWLFMLFHQMAPRTSETIGLMGQFRRSMIGGSYSWVWNITGKGGAQREVPITASAMAALAELRGLLRISPTPRNNDPIPIIPSLARLTDEGILKGIPKSLTRNSIYKINKSILRVAIAHADSKGIDTGGFEMASSHWLRHTSLRELADETGDMRLVQLMAGHRSIEISARYVTQSIGELQAGMKLRRYSS